MPNGRVIFFNKRGRWDWLDSGCDIDEDELKQEEGLLAICIIRQTLEYDTSMHDHQITEWLSKPEELVRYERGR